MKLNTNTNTNVVLNSSKDVESEKMKMKEKENDRSEAGQEEKEREKGGMKNTTEKSLLSLSPSQIEIEIDQSNEEEGEGEKEEELFIVHNPRSGVEVTINCELLSSSFSISKLESRHIASVADDSQHKSSYPPDYQAILGQLACLKDVVGDSYLSVSADSGSTSAKEGGLFMLSSDGKILQQLCLAVLDLRIHTLNESYNKCLPLLEMIPRLRKSWKSLSLSSSLSRSSSDADVDADADFRIVDFQDIASFVRTGKSVLKQSGSSPVQSSQVKDLRFNGLFLYTVDFLFDVECCIRLLALVF